MSEDKIEMGVHDYLEAASWVAPKEPVLAERLEWFLDQKLALMIHWGIYSQMGITESWPLSDEDAPWSRVEVDWEKDGETFRRQYFGLNKSFNPIRFEPTDWADLASENGFKYLIFTTKHHDGFCMWDTEQTDFKVTGEDCPFHTHKYADIVKNTFDAFREKGLAIAAYFSKPDWHSPYYWAQGMAQGSYTTRNPTYDVREYPWLWERFTRFTHKQILEIISHYGKIDILWLDGGQVRPDNGQDIHLGEVVEKARRMQPWLLVADRTVGGPYENYITPEQTVPPEALDVPWESCITMGTSFSFKYEDTYKSLRELIHLLIDVVCKGGNLALNVGIQPDGRMPACAIERMKGIGKWLKINGEAIYGTRPCSPYKHGSFAFTKKESATYAFYLCEEGEEIKKERIIPYHGSVQTIEMLGCTEALTFARMPEGLLVKLPSEQLKENEPIAYVFKMM